MTAPRTFEPEELAAALASAQWEDMDFSNCPDPEDLWHAASGDLSPDRVVEITEHAACCPVCFHDLRAARQAAADLEELRPVPQPDPSPILDSQPWFKVIVDVARTEVHKVYQAFVDFGRIAKKWVSGGASDGVRENGNSSEGVRVRSLAGAVAALGLATVAVLVVRPLGPGSNSPATDRTAAALPVIQLLVPDGQELPPEDFVLRWQELPGARYDLHLMTPELDEVAFLTHLTATEARIEVGALRQLPAGAVLQWRVVAHLPGGERVESEPGKVRLGGATSGEEGKP